MIWRNDDKIQTTIWNEWTDSDSYRWNCRAERRIKFSFMCGWPIAVLLVLSPETIELGQAKGSELYLWTWIFGGGVKAHKSAIPLVHQRFEKNLLLIFTLNFFFHEYSSSRCAYCLSLHISFEFFFTSSTKSLFSLFPSLYQKPFPARDAFSIFSA